MQGLARQVEDAAAADKYDEATALQAELDSSTEEADALAAEYTFTPDNMQDLVSLPTPPTHHTQTQDVQVGDNQAVDTREEHGHKGTSAPVAASKEKVTAEAGSGTQPAATEEGSTERKPQGSEDLSNALSREGIMEYEDRESVDGDEDGMHVGYSSSVISASHAATDGSRSVQSSRTVLDRMPEFNMDDAVSFR